MSENVNVAFIDIERLAVNRFWLGPGSWVKRSKCLIISGSYTFRLSYKIDRKRFPERLPLQDEFWRLGEVIQVGTYYLL